MTDDDQKFAGELIETARDAMEQLAYRAAEIEGRNTLLSVIVIVVAFILIGIFGQ